MGDRYDDFLDGPDSNSGDQYDRFLDEPDVQTAPRPSMMTRFISGVAQKDISQPKGFDAGDVAEFVGREFLPAAGSMMGAAGGPLGVAAGAVAGRSIQKGVGAYLGATNPELKSDETPLQAIGDVALSGATAGLTQAAVNVGAPLARAFMSKAKNAAVDVGAQMLKAGPGIPEKYGRAALRDPSLLSRAPSKEAVSQAYQGFEAATGLKSLRNAAAGRGDLLLKPGQAEGIVNSAFQKIGTNTLTAQEAYEASQAASFLKNQARFGNPDQLANLSNINRAKDAFDDILETLYPDPKTGYKSLRTGAFEQKAAEQFESLLPLNKNQSPNVLRTWTVGAAAAGGLAAGSGAGFAALPLISPKVAGLAIRAASGTARAASRLGAKEISELAGRGGAANLAQDWIKPKGAPINRGVESFDQREATFMRKLVPPKK